MSSLFSQDGVEELTDRLVHLERVTQSAASHDPVAVSAADSLASEVSLGFEVRDDARDRPFGDADPVGDVTLTSLRILGEAHQDVRVIRQECPGAIVHS
jgi:hypothetical protein